MYYTGEFDSERIIRVKAEVKDRLSERPYSINRTFSKFVGSFDSEQKHISTAINFQTNNQSSCFR